MANKLQTATRTDIEAAAAEGMRTLALASDAALKLMAQQASESLKVTTDAAAAQLKIVAEAAAVAARAMDEKNSADHEAIIEMKGDIRSILKSLKVIEDAESTRKLNPTFTNGHELRLIALEGSRNIQTVLTSIGVGLLCILTSILTYHIINHPMLKP